MSHDKYSSSHQILVGVDPEVIVGTDKRLSISSQGTMEFSTSNDLSNINLSTSGTVSNIVLSAEGTSSDVRISGEDTVVLESLVRYIDIYAEGTLFLESASDDILVTSANDIVIESAGNTVISTTGVGNKYVGLISGDPATESPSAGIYVGDSGLNFIGASSDNNDVLIKGSSEGDHILRIVNDKNDVDASGVAIYLSSGYTTDLSADNSGRKWISFYATSTFPLRGSIRGGGYTEAAFVTDGSYSPAIGASGLPVAIGTYDCVYASGGADYGEWLAIGDLDEWGINREDTLANINGRLGLPEGWVVYVRDNAFWKEGPGTPMVVTQRAMVVGNEREHKDPYIGEILSFIGQVPVIVNGPVKSGDFLIPSGSMFCTAKDPATITFEEYMKVIGTAWESKEEAGQGLVLCAIGVKNTF